MFPNFILKQMLKSQLGKMSKSDQEKVLEAFDKNPAFFQDLAKEIGERTKNGEPQMQAVMAVVAEHKADLEKILKP